MKALVRPPGDSFRRALSSRPPPAIDIELARRQHAAYCAALRQVGLDLSRSFLFPEQCQFPGNLRSWARAR